MSEKMMDALVKTGPVKGLTLKQVPVPTPGPGEVLIKIHKTAICGTDVHIYNWDPWSQQQHEPAPGHRPRICGRDRRSWAPGSTDYHVGQRVSGEGHIICGHCRNCRSGNGQWCPSTKGVGVQPGRRLCRIPVHPRQQCGARGRKPARGRGRLLRRLWQRHPYRPACGTWWAKTC